MHKKICLGLAALSLAFVGCDDSSSSDPKTVNRSELNPPMGLTTVTGDKKIQLRWSAANAEDDFKGYHVFAVAKTVGRLAEVEAAIRRLEETVERLWYAPGMPGATAAGEDFRDRVKALTAPER